MQAFLFIFFSIFCLVTASNECHTPKGEAGKCTLINNCPPLFSLLMNNSKNGTSSDQLRQYHCGFESLLFPKVCCPIQTLQTVEGQTFSKYGTNCGIHTPDSISDPWLVLLEYEIRKPSDEERLTNFVIAGRATAVLCGGVVINKRYVLTAAHCVYGPKMPRNAKMYAGCSSKFGFYHLVMIARKIIHAIVGQNTSVVPVEDVIVHEEYNPWSLNQYHDIALVRLKRNLSFKKDNTRAICLSNKDMSKLINKMLPSVGWELSNSHISKREGIATVWENSDCSKKFNTTDLVDSQICAGGRKQHNNHYGGILMHLNDGNIYSLLGIVSLEPQVDDKEQYKIYTRVASYLDWIIGHMKW